jgi:hypothetical protein
MAKTKNKILNWLYVVVVTYTLILSVFVIVVVLWKGFP